MRQSKTTRRGFLTQAAALGMGATLAGCATTGSAADKSIAVAQADATAAAAKRSRRELGPDDIIRCGFIGVGSRGSGLLQTVLARDDVDVVAVCDAYDVWRERGLEWCRAKRPDVAGYLRFEDMIAEEELDAVVIATPDHIHAPAILCALDAGCDVYTEKPMTLTWQEARDVYLAAQATGAVLQVGTQLRSTDMYQKAREIVQAGRIGKVVEVQVNRHMRGGFTDQYQPPEEANESNVHWDLFLRDTHPYPFDLRRFFTWRLFKEYSNGVTGDLMLHHLDACHYIMGCGMPSRVMSVGGIFAFPDGRTCPDTISALLDYPAEKFHFNYTTTTANGRYGVQERYLGTEGTIEMRNMGAMTVWSGDEEEVITATRLDTAAHFENFFSCMRTRQAPIAPKEAGLMGAVCCAMAVMSQNTGEAVKWNPDAGRIGEVFI